MYIFQAEKEKKIKKKYLKDVGSVGKSVLSVRFYLYNETIQKKENPQIKTNVQRLEITMSESDKD